MRDTILPSNKIILAMGMSEMTHQSLRHEIMRYINVSEAYVQNVIINGASGSIANLVAFLLGIKNHIPEGYDPISSMVQPTVFKKVDKKQINKLTRSITPHIPGKHWTKEELELVALLKHSGAPYPVIAKMLGRTVTSVKAIIKKRLDF